MAEYKDVTLIMQEIEQGKHNLKFKNAEYAEVFSSALAFFQGVIDRVPVADVVEVVRCKECLYNANGICVHSEFYDDTTHRPDYFCADGERKRLTVQKINRQYEEGDGVEILFYDNNIAIGTACTVNLREHNGNVTVFLHGFEVKEQYRRQGYGTQILKYMIDNFAVELLYVERGNEAIKLYKRFGFEVVYVSGKMITMRRKQVQK